MDSNDRFEYTKLRVTQIPGDREEVMRKLDIANVHTMRSDWQLVNPLLKLRWWDAIHRAELRGVYYI